MKNFNHKPDEHSIYLFCGKRCDRIKVLFKDCLIAILKLYFLLSNFSQNTQYFIINFICNYFNLEKFKYSNSTSIN
ncbi:MAG: hypothetical protein ACLSIF_11050 [Faecalimonas umbilicata]